MPKVIYLCSQCNEINPPGIEGDTCLHCGVGIIFQESSDDQEIEEIRELYRDKFREREGA